VNSRTTQKLTELDSFAWFTKVGQPFDGNSLLIRGWQEAVESSSSEIWSSVQHQVKNHMADEVARKNYARFEEWNVVAEKIRKVITVIFNKRIDPVVKQFRLKSDFRDSVTWDMLMICMETEFTDVIPPMFAVPRLLPIYAAGHFPCGWEGPILTTDWNGELGNWRLAVY
jgi:hypothetical protein